MYETYRTVKMPFAKRIDSDDIISILDAERGLACNCQCLSCGTVVTARQGDQYQWHFSHTISEDKTANECEFSPVTAIALILRQQFPNLRNFDVDDLHFTNATWEIGATIGNQRVDALVTNPETRETIIFDIPYADSKPHDYSVIKYGCDAIIKIHTHLIARSIFAPDGEITLLSTSQVFERLLDNWNEWAELLYLVTEEPKPEPNMANVTQTANKETQNNSYEQVTQTRTRPICACCNEAPADHMRGVLCGQCVRKHVGSTYPNMSQMAKAFKKNH